MLKNTFFFWLLIVSLLSCHTNAQNKVSIHTNQTNTALKPLVGSAQFELYRSKLNKKRVGVVANQGSVIINTNGDYTHLIDTLLTQGVNIVKVFSPEHGFRGKADAGEAVDNTKDKKTGLPIISLYGSNKKTKPAQLKDIDLMLFDLQDVGVRFYTYISTLHYVMEACAQHNIPVILMDRPNPNIHYIDGPTLKSKYKSFVGLHEVPVVYGMSIGEYGSMINGEKWLNGGVACDLTVIPVKHYTRQSTYDIPIKPSPNLPNAKAVNLYPSLCFFEGTAVSCGRGTNTPFQIFGAPKLPSSSYPFTFIPEPNDGSKNPKHSFETCHGLDLTNHKRLDKLNLNWLLETYNNYRNPNAFFTSYFNTLAGTNELIEQIKLGYSEEDIRKTWQPDIERFKKIRAKYLIYQ